jgi:hypothetical protein
MTMFPQISSTSRTDPKVSAGVGARWILARTLCLGASSVYEDSRGTLFGVRRVLELEQGFLYLCLHDGRLLDLPALCSALEAKRPTVSSYFDLLEATHLIHRLRPFDLRQASAAGRFKIYLADAAIGPSVLLKGKALLRRCRRASALWKRRSSSTSSPVIIRVASAFPTGEIKMDREVDIIADMDGDSYTTRGLADLKGMTEFCDTYGVERGYVITRELADFKV